ncbi:MAG: hypothetical protein ABFC89_04710 [Methanospirillum sp.]
MLLSRLRIAGAPRHRGRIGAGREAAGYDRFLVSDFVEDFEPGSLLPALLFVSEREALFFVSWLVSLFGIGFTKPYYPVI